MLTANIPLLAGKGFQQPKKIIVHSLAQFIIYEDEDMYAPYFLRKIGLSAHILVDPSGIIIKCKEDHQIAAHAKGYNTNSLGIEFLVPGIHNYESFLESLKAPYLTSDAFNAGVKVIKGWMIKYNIDKMDVVTHQEIDPDRKYDPGTIEGDRILNAL